jgi:3-oxoacyl-[acyl-carrier-protein] synthase II
MSDRKVVITGLGIISCLGLNVQDYWDNLLKGKSGIKKVERFDPSDYASQIAGEIVGFDPLDYLDKKLVKRVDRFIHYALPATDEAVRDANLDKDLDKLDNDRIGVIFGSGIGGIESFYNTSVSHAEEPGRKVSPFFIPSLITNMAPGQIAIKYCLKGPNYSISTACATAAHSIIEAANAIRRGESDIMISGGSEAPVTSIGFAGFLSARALSTRNDEPEKASRPFDIDRDGFVMSEGAGAIVLESEESAKKRGVKIYAELVSGGMSCDAYHMTAPRDDGSGAAVAINSAIRSAGIEKEKIDYINTHGTSTPLGDIAETIAIKNVFGNHANKIKLNSTKSMIGHMLGAAGVAELIAVIKSIQDKKIHGTLNIENQDPKCDLDYCANGSIDLDINYALSNSFGFGGQNASIIVAKYNS